VSPGAVRRPALWSARQRLSAGWGRRQSRCGSARRSRCGSKFCGRPTAPHRAAAGRPRPTPP